MGRRRSPCSIPFRIDLLLTDIVMPGLNGRELADRLHARQPGLKVLFMTGYSRSAGVHQGRLDPGVSLLQKPLTQALLAAKIRELLDKRLTSATLPRNACGSVGFRSRGA